MGSNSAVGDKNDWRSLCPPGMPAYLSELLDPTVVSAQQPLKNIVDAKLKTYTEEEQEEFQYMMQDESWRSEDSTRPMLKAQQRALLRSWLAFVSSYRPGRAPFHFQTILGGIAQFLRVKAILVKPTFGNAQLAPRTLSKIAEGLMRLFLRFMVDDAGCICGPAKFASLGLYDVFSDTVRDYIVRYKLRDRYAPAKVFKGLPELRLLISHALKSSENGGRIMMIQIISALTLSFFYATRPSTLFGADNECVKQGRYFKVGDIKRILLSKTGIWTVEFEFRNFKGFNHADKEKVVYHSLRSVKRVENILFDPGTWLILFLILQGHIEGISSVDDLARTNMAELYIKPESKKLPLYCQGGVRGLTLDNESAMPMKTSNYNKILKRLGIGSGIGNTSTYEFRREGGTRMAQMIGTELAVVAMGHSTSTNRIFHNHYSRCLMYEDLVGLQFGEHILDPVQRAEAKNKLQANIRSCAAVTALIYATVVKEAQESGEEYNGLLVDSACSGAYKFKLSAKSLAQVDDLPEMRMRWEAVRDVWVNRVLHHYDFTGADAESLEACPISIRAVSSRAKWIKADDEGYEADFSLLRDAFEQLRDTRRRERRRLLSKLTPDAESHFRKVTEKEYKTEAAVDAAVAACSLDAPADQLILDSIAAYNSSGALGVSASSSCSSTLTCHVSSSSSDSCGDNLPRGPVPSSSTVPSAPAVNGSDDDDITLVDLFNEPDGQNGRNDNCSIALYNVMGKEYVPLTSDAWHDANDRREAEEETSIRAEGDGFGLETPDEPVTIDNIDLRSAKLCLYNLVAEPIMLERAIAAFNTIEGQYSCHICAKWPAGVSLKSTPFRQTPFTEKCLLYRHIRDRHNTWTDFYFEMVKGVQPGTFTCPDKDFVGVSILEVQQHMLTDCSKRTEFKVIYDASRPAAAERQAVRVKKNNEGRGENSKKTEQTDGNQQKNVEEGNGKKRHAKRKGATSLAVSTSARNEGVPSVVAASTPVTVSLGACVNALTRDEKPWHTRKITASSLKSFGCLTMDDFQYLNKKHGIVPSEDAVQGFNTVVRVLANLQQNDQCQK